MATLASLEAVQKAYIAYYGRPADPAGLEYWAGRADAEGMEAIIDAFGNSAEANELFGGMSTADMLNTLYNQIFGRDADPEGLAFYTAELDAGRMTAASIALNVMNGAQGGDATIVANKLAVANNFTAALDTAEEQAAYNSDSAPVVRSMLSQVGEGTNADSFNGVESAIAQISNPQSIFTLTEIRTELPDTVPTQMATYWGNPETGEGVPVQELLDIVSGYLSEDIKADLFDMGDILEDLKLITEIGITDMMQGGGPGDQFNGDAATGGDDADTGYDTGKEGDYTGNYQIRVELSDGTINEAIVTLTQEQFEFLNGLMFDADGNSRLYEQEVAYQIQARDADGNLMFADVLNDQGQTVQEPILVDAVVDGGYIEYPIILTPTQNNGGTEEIGKTSAADDFIVAARLELLHGAYIDGGEGENTLEIDAKGHFAQPKELLNIQHINVENLPNVYTVDNNERVDSDNRNDYPDVQEVNNGDADSIIDLSRATDIETLTVTEGNFEGLDGQEAVGTLTIAGIRNGITTTLDGGFTQNVTLHYGELQGEGVNLVLNNVSMGDAEGSDSNASLNVAHNAEELTIETTGGDSYLANGYLGGQLNQLTITGTEQLFIRGDLAESFQKSTPATIDASANTGGVDLNIQGHDDEIVFLGTAAADDHFVAGPDSNTAVRSVSISGGEGNGEYVANALGDVVITAGNGDNEITATSTGNDGNENEDTVTVTVGNGQNDITLSSSDAFYLIAGDGDNRIEAEGNTGDNGGLTEDDLSTIVVGDGQNEIDATGALLSITAGDGANEIAATDAEGDNGNVTIVAGNGGNAIAVDGYETVAITTGSGDDAVTLLGGDVDLNSDGGSLAGENGDETLINLDLGAGNNTLTLGADAGNTNAITALDGSSITGENITLKLDTDADLSRAELSGIIAVEMTDADNLTLTVEQFQAIGADAFTVLGESFGANAELNLVVSESISLDDLDIESLPRGIDVSFELKDEVELTLTARQLHERVAVDGITLNAEAVANGDLPSATVMILEADDDFNAWADNVGSLSDDFATDSVKIEAVPGGYARPTVTQNLNRISINTDELVDGQLQAFESSAFTFLRITGDAGAEFAPIKGGIDDWGLVTDPVPAIVLGDHVDGQKPFMIDYSSVGGEISGMIIDNFENAERIYGNASETIDARLDVILDGTLGDADQGLVSSGVETYVVVEAAENAEFWTCETTQDLTTLGLQGNVDITFRNTELNVDFLIETEYSKSLGYQAGDLTVGFARAGADAVVNVVALDALPEDAVQQIGTITFGAGTDAAADTATINVTGGDAAIAAVVGVNDVTFTADGDLMLQSFAANITALDVTGVAGDFGLAVAAAGTADLTGLESVEGIDLIQLGAGATLTLTADQAEALKDIIVDADPEDLGAATVLVVTGYTGQNTDFSSIDVDTVQSVTFEDNTDVTVGADVDFAGAEVVLSASEEDVAVAMTYAQYESTADADADTLAVEVDNGTNDVTLTLTAVPVDQALTLDAIAGEAAVVLEVAGTATADMTLVDTNNHDVTLVVTADADLTEATIGTVDQVEIAEGATLTLTQAQVVALLGDTDGDDVADNFAGAGTLNIVDVDGTAAMDLDTVQAAGLTIGTITLVNDGSVVNFSNDATTTFGGAAEIITPTADAGAPEYGTESTSVEMSVAQFETTAGVISGDAQVNLTGLYNNVDTDGDFIPDAANFDLSAIANAGTLSFAEDTVNVTGNGAQHFVTLTDAADLGGFTIALGNGELIRFANEAQAAATITADAADVTGVQWLWTAFGAEVDTSGYDADITSLFIDEALLASQNVEEDLWTDLPGSIVVQKINGTVIPELIALNRTNTFEAFTNLAQGVNYNDSAEFSTIANLTINLEGEVNLGGVLLGDTQNGDGSTPNIDGVGFLESVTINSYLDLTTTDYDTTNVPGVAIDNNTVGDISLNAGSVDQLVNVTINTYNADADNDTGTVDGGYTDAANVNGELAERDGIAINTGTITFAANDAETEATLTLTGYEDITIAGVDYSNANLSMLTVNMTGMNDGAAPAVTIGGINYRDFDYDSDDDNADGVALDTVTFLNGDYAGDDTFGAAGQENLLVVDGGTVDLTGADLTQLNALQVVADAEITLTADQVQAIAVGDFTLAAGVNATLNVTDVDGADVLDLDVIEAAGFNIGTVTVVADGVTLNAGTTLGGADSLVIASNDDAVSNDGVTMTAAQYQGFSGVITEAGTEAASVTITQLAEIATDEDGDTVAETVAIDLSTVATTGDHQLWLTQTGDDTAVDLTLAASTDLSDFALNLIDVTSTVTANELAGQTVRFVNAVQAERTINVEGGDASPEDDVNVVWNFNTITGTETAGKVDTSGYSADIGRVWMLESLVSGQNVEELYTTLNESIIIRVVNEDDLDTLLFTQGFDRHLEIESFTTLGDLTFSDIDEAGQPLDFVEKLTIDLGGEVSMGDIIVSNVLANPVDNDDEFDTLTINSFVASNGSGAEYLLPEGYSYGNTTGDVPYPDEGNTIGDIASGSAAFDLGTVVVNTANPTVGTADLTAGTVTFSDDGDLLTGGTSVATFQVNGNGNVTVKSLDTSDADITGLTIDHNGTGTLTVTGGSPAFDGGMAAGNTETLTITTEAGDVNLGTATDTANAVPFAGVAGEELSVLNVTTAGGAVDLGTIALIDSSDDNVGTVNESNAFELIATTSNGGTVTARLGTANVNGNLVAPTLDVDSTWVFSDVDLTIAEPTAINGTLVLNNVELTIEGDVDLTNATLDFTGVDIFVPAGESLTLTLDQINEATNVTGEGTVFITGEVDTDAAFNLDLSNIETVGIDLSGITNAGVIVPQANVVAIQLAANALDDDNAAAGFKVVGTAFNDTVTGSAQDDTFTMGAGDDTIDGGDGNDSFNVDAGTDTINDLFSNADLAEPTEVDVLTVSAGATVEATTDGDFVATADTSNAGTATITAAAGATIDMTDASGPNGYEIVGNAADNSANALVGSAFADTINGGDALADSAVDVDVLTGNGGGDTFQVNVDMGQTTTLALETTQVNVDREKVTIGNISVAGTTATVNYTVNGAALSLTINTITTDSAALATALAQALNNSGVFIGSASAEGADLTITAVTGQNIEFGTDGAGTDAITTDGTLDSFTVDNEATSLDTAQVTVVTGTGDPTQGDQYSISSLLDGATTIDSYTALLNDTAEDVVANVVNGLDADITITDGTANDAVYTLTATGAGADAGGFTLTTDTTAAFGGAGTGVTLATADIITDFVSGVDKVEFVTTTDTDMLAGDGSNYLEGANVATFALAEAAATTAFNNNAGALQYYLTSATDLDGVASTGLVDGQEGAGILFFDGNLDGLIDGSILLVGITEANFSAFDIIAS